MTDHASELPDAVESEDALDELLSRPSVEISKYIANVASPLVVLGAGGKMGPTLCVMAKRAAEAAGHSLDVIAVSRFSDPRKQEWLESRGVTTRSLDLLDEKAIGQLPDARDVIYLVGLKFGTSGNPCPTWAVNTLVPAAVARRYAASRIVALSTGNVYPLVPAGSNGARESDPLTPLGEYANAAVARERIFGYFSQTLGAKVCLVRLNYAAELRYGVLLDIAQKVARDEPVDVGMGYLNCIWQGDANDRILRCLELAESPARAINLTGPEKLSIRELAKQLGELLRRRPQIAGDVADSALLSDASESVQLFGLPRFDAEIMLRWIAHWIQIEGPTWDRPTHFEVRDGSY